MRCPSSRTHQHPIGQQRDALPLAQLHHVQLWPAVNDAVLHLVADDLDTSIQHLHHSQTGSSAEVPYLNRNGLPGFARPIVGRKWLLRASIWHCKRKRDCKTLCPVDGIASMGIRDTTAAPPCLSAAPSGCPTRRHSGGQTHHDNWQP